MSQYSNDMPNKYLKKSFMEWNKEYFSFETPPYPIQNVKFVWSKVIETSLCFLPVIFPCGFSVKWLQGQESFWKYKMKISSPFLLWRLKVTALWIGLFKRKINWKFVYNPFKRKNLANFPKKRRLCRWALTSVSVFNTCWMLLMIINIL